ncbi:MAG: energy transducer TonB [Saprospiraceae bacterium]|nr:energy transducer TonB [Saprospiraceae bacterium]
MKSPMNSDFEWLELVFEHRNKAYGAYRIRQRQSSNMIKAMLIAFFLFVLAAFSSSIWANMKNAAIAKENCPEEIWHEWNTDVPVEKPMDIKPPIKETRTIAIKKAGNTEGFKVVKDSALVAKKELEPVTENAGNQSQEEGIGLTDETIPVGTSSGTESINTETGTNTKEEPIRFAEEMPQFGKGEKDLMDYLAKNIRYPQMAKENRIEGRVTAEFIVDKTGSVREVKILRGIGAGCDEMVGRILSTMPKWKPGKHNGKNVSVKMVLPVGFKLN